MAKAKVKEEKDPSLSLGSIWKEICRKQKVLMIMMIVLALMSVILLFFALTTLRHRVQS